MRTLVFLVEEYSAKALLEGILPRLVPRDIVCRIIVFEGKQDLEKRLEKRVRGWVTPDTRFIVLRDKDSGDCHAIKKRLREKLVRAGRPDSIVRIACHELESFFLGDLAAVEKALGLHGLMKQQQRAKYRRPDAIGNPSLELKQMTHYQKVEGARAIAPHLNLQGENRSHSFRVLIAAIRSVSNSV